MRDTLELPWQSPKLQLLQKHFPQQSAKQDPAGTEREREEEEEERGEHALETGTGRKKTKPEDQTKGPVGSGTGRALPRGSGVESVPPDRHGGRPNVNVPVHMPPDSLRLRGGHRSHFCIPRASPLHGAACAAPAALAASGKRCTDTSFKSATWEGQRLGQAYPMHMQ